MSARCLKAGKLTFAVLDHSEHILGYRNGSSHTLCISGIQAHALTSWHQVLPQIWYLLILLYVSPHSSHVDELIV